MRLPFTLFISARDSFAGLRYNASPGAAQSPMRQGSCELYTFGWGLGAANPPQPPTIGEVRRGHPEGTRAPPHLPNCKADRCQAKPCLSPIMAVTTPMMETTGSVAAKREMAPRACSRCATAYIM